MSDERWFEATDAVDKVKESQRVKSRVEGLVLKFQEVLENDNGDLSLAPHISEEGIDTWAQVSLDRTDSKNEILSGNCAKVVRFVRKNKNAVKVRRQGGRQG